ncbi:hypothetical protein WJX81_007002 [Elliptochloris bilobata]|uniref:Uncharacterized protein n=1 Tax=Elliptochloris bilobata TaxID=381761 RepID=A0AAW1R054_9CHLO
MRTTFTGTAITSMRINTRRSPCLPVQAAFKAAVKGKKALVAGKDIKAQQFEIGLGKDKKRVALGFTKSNELFVGHVAMLGVATSIIGGQVCAG